MPRVYCINRYGNPIESASKFGEIVEIIEGNINPFSVDRLAFEIAPALANFNAEDYLLLTGPGSSYIISAVLLYSRLDTINCLRYESTVRDYINVPISRSEIASKLTEMYGDSPLEDDDPNMPGRIFVLNYSGHAIQSALTQFTNSDQVNSLEIITRGNINQFKIDKMVHDVIVGLEDFGHGDMLLLSGPALLHIIASAVLLETQPNFSVLIYNPKNRNYIKREVDANHLREISSIATAA